MNPADLWELLTKHGIQPDSATAIVKSHAGMGDADLWERLTKNGATPDAATTIVNARGPVTTVPASTHGATATFDTEPAPQSAPWQAHVLNTLQGIPGMEAMQAFIGKLGTNMSYEDSRNRIKDATSQINPATAAAERFGGSLLALPMLPANPVAAGALLGGADQLLSADPNQSLTERGVRTAAGSAGGAAVGKALDLGVTALRSVLAKSPGALVEAKLAAREASANTNYAKALAEGKGKAATPAVQAFLAKPDIAEIVTGLQQTRQFANAAPESPEMLDAIYKVLSDQQKAIDKGLEAVNPTKANIGRFRKADVVAAKQDAVAAISGPGGPMPSYANAVTDYAEKTAALKAQNKGYDALRWSTYRSMPAAQNIPRVTPEAFAKWAQTATPAEKKAAAEGILSALGETDRVKFGSLLGTPVVPMPSRALRAAPGLLRNVESQNPFPVLGLLGMRSP